MKKHKFLLVGLLLVIVSVGFINLPRVEAQTATPNAAYIQQLINQLLALVAKLQEQLAILQGQSIQQISAPAGSSIDIFWPVNTPTLIPGQTYTIRWTSNNVSTLNIFLGSYSNALLHQDIAINIPASLGFYTWTVPGYTAPADDYRIHLQQVLSPTHQGVWDQESVSVSGTRQAEPALRGFRARVVDRATGVGLAGVEVRIERGGTYVASPTTGADGYITAIPLRVGENHTFTFSKSGYRPYSPVNLIIPSGAGTYTYGTIWLESETITTAPPSTPLPTITVTSPTANAQWMSDQGHTVTWSTNGVGGGNNITIELLTPSNGSVSGFNAFTTANDYNESMSITSVAPGFYYFRLKAIVNGQTVYGGSGVFQVIAPAATPVSPSAVCGNGVIESGEQCDGSQFLPGNSCATYGYTSGNLSCTASCAVSLTQCANPPAPAGSINVTSPTANSIWSSNHTVSWTSNNVPASNTVMIELLTPSGGQIPGSWQTTTMNDGSHFVNISAVAPGFYYFRLKTTVSGQTVFGGSPVFQVVSN